METSDGSAVEGRPEIYTAEAVEAARELYGLDVEAAPLPGERDRNYRLETSEGEAYVLKVSRLGEDRELLRFQEGALARLREADLGYAFPRTLADRSGREISRLEDGRGREHAVRLLEWIPGRPLARFRPHTPELLEEVGTLLGRVDGTLQGYRSPAAGRPFYWDLRGARREIARHLPAVRDPERRALLDRHLERFERHGDPLLSELRTGIIHGDGNDHNILVAVPGDPLEPPRVVGLVDFGDMVESWVAAEAAVGAAYAMLGKADPLEAAARVAAGYHGAHPLDGPEVDALFPLACLRLCLSVVLAAHQRSRAPENAYLSVSEGPAWALLQRLADVSPAWARTRLREACRMPPVPEMARAEAWLRSRRGSAGPVLEPDPRDARPAVLDFSVGAAGPGAIPGPGAEAGLAGVWRRRPDGADGDPAGATAPERGAPIGIGRYGEIRRWCTTERFRVETDAGPAWRTLHLGLDLVAPTGTPVLAPLDGVVADVRSDGVTAPSVLLRHEPAAEIRFHTLLRGLRATDTEALEVGREVTRGERLGRVGGAGSGPAAEGPAGRNVRPGPPRLHIQLVLDPVDRGAALPGVVRPGLTGAWRRLCPDPNLLLGIPDVEAAGGGMKTDRILEVRRRRLGPNLSVSYDRPLRIVRGWMQHLVDADGRAYLDGVNNVAHVGHCHPRVVEALRRQAAVLNTNTRYLHELLVRYARRLTATLPDPLRVCWFVCSGSEANELALRLARTHTGSRGVLVIDGAYHGNTSSLVELSPYKFSGPGGERPPPWVRTVPMPDPYRGRHRGAGRETGARYAAHVREVAKTARESEHGLAAFFCEPLLGCGGQVVPPKGYLAEAFAAVREAGGVCVADEVQIGFGRVGTHFWGFETQGVVPDIVTLGKPIGNGHPLGAVVTTPEIAASFDTGMEYFNTFGGNPVSCAVGLAVLDVIEEEGLQDRARRVGARLRQGLEAVMERRPLIGEVRGRGLFLGVELVTDREVRDPAPRHAKYVVERMRELGILLSTDGPDHDVIKIKPPLPFSEGDADRLVETLDRVLAEDPVRVD